MSVRFRLACCAVLIITLLAGCGSGAGSVPAPPSASKAVTELQVAAQRELKIDKTRLISLSPDGQWLAAVRDKSVCIVAVDTLADKQCADTKTGSPDMRSFVWSPDSKRLVFTEDLPRFMLESDIWLLDVESGQLTDLTPDNVAGGFIKLPKDSAALLDTMPGWSPDGQMLFFSRGLRSGEVALYTLAASGGTPQKLLDIPGGGIVSTWYGPHWLSNGKIVYTVYHSKQGDPDNGVWMVESTGQNARQLVKRMDEQMGLPILSDVSVKGDRALIWYTAAMQYATKPNVSYFALLDLSSGRLEPLKPAGEFMSPLNARFSPDGSKIAYVYRTLDNQVNLVIRDVQSGAENTVLTQSGILGATTDSPMQGLDWANNDTLYAATGPGGGTLLTLSSK